MYICMWILQSRYQQDRTAYAVIEKYLGVVVVVNVVGEEESENVHNHNNNTKLHVIYVMCQNY